MVDFTKLSALAAAAASVKDQTKAQAGGGDYVPPAEGACKLRLISYIELGKHIETFKGQKKVREKVRIEFEVSGPNHPPRIDDDGKKHPIIIVLEDTLSLNERARFFKLFTRLNYAGKAVHCAQLVAGDESLGLAPMQPYKGKIMHRKYKRTDGSEGVAVELWDKTNALYNIEPPRIPERDAEGLETGGFTIMNVEAALSAPRIFLWDFADLDQWASIFIEGEYPERKNDAGVVTHAAKSKNVIQNKIKLASNFIGSPIHTALLAQGQTIDIPDAEAGRAPELEGTEAEVESDPAAEKFVQKVLEGAAATDALNGIA